MKYYVSASSPISGDGSVASPFQKIQEAALIAKPGDEVLVLPGIYRESVDPLFGGTPEAPIVYRSLEPLKAVITGAERFDSWILYEKNVWKLEIPNTRFGSYNPYTTIVAGDWIWPQKNIHTGEVYLNGTSMYEVLSLDEVLHPVANPKAWDPSFSLYTWYTCQTNESTVIYANFHDADPNTENVELNVRQHCFYPEETGKNYITLSGFTVCKAATKWAPPTALQDGMIGPHWAKGWIIEDCDISNSKCSGISLGKYLQPNNENKWTTRYTKDGTQNERDSICQARNEGWTKENIGSHIIRRCHIHDCGQTGIVGHLGGVFSIIEDNHIHHINTKQDLSGDEIGGIKMHAAIDVIIRRNHIHHCTRGIWLDWQIQGTRVTQNLFHHNTPPVGTEMTNELSLGEDLFLEVAHGPSLIDNNILLSLCSARISTQGVAFVHNLIGGSFTYVGNGVDNGGKKFPSERYTPYHVPHSTDIAGFMTILHGDMRFYNNIFIQQKVNPFYETYAKEYLKDFQTDKMHFISGTLPYETYPLTDEYFSKFTAKTCIDYWGNDRYYDHLPVSYGGNIYFNGARPCSRETDAIVNTSDQVWIDLQEKNGKYILSSNLCDFIKDSQTAMIHTDTLGEAFEPEQKFENPDGSPITFDKDYFGKTRSNHPACGPFEELREHYELF